MRKTLALWRTVRRLGVAGAGRWLAQRHQQHIREVLVRELGRQPANSELRAAQIGAQGLIEGLF